MHEIALTIKYLAEAIAQLHLVNGTEAAVDQLIAKVTELTDKVNA